MSIELTEAGLEIANENEKQVSKYTVFDVLTDEEKTLYSEMTQKLIDALDQDLPQDEEAFVKLIKKLRNHRGGHGRGSRGFGPGRGFGRDPRSFGHERDFRGFGPGQGFRGFEGGHDFDERGFEHETDHRHFKQGQNNSATNSPQNEDGEK
ncbi:hypothetical protein [Bacillus massiliigorillae]|uniref:hypothetical protein n=1 Tax=Bacillus massiliigorillae TaxID=1243664 RepID=UPI0003A52692|nr:hypothetical protein [Bacillus massiliigorillae]